jgi:hypothetical protein
MVSKAMRNALEMALKLKTRWWLVNVYTSHNQRRRSSYAGHVL